MSNTTITRFKNSLSKLEVYKCEYRTKFLPYYLDQTVIGLLLSDGSLEKSSPSSSARLSIIFGEKHLPYLLHLYNLLEPYTDNYFDLSSVYNKSSDKRYNVVKFKTASLPVFTYYYNMFYVHDSVTRKNKKIMPMNIDKLISPISLAHLIMGDGNIKTEDKIIRIYTNSFGKEEVSRLASAIYKELNVYAKVVHDRKDQHILTISRNQSNKLTPLILPYMHTSMLYKLGNLTKVGDFSYFRFKELI